MWELRESFGDRAGFVWLECLSIADRNQGIVGPASDQTRNQLASKCRTSRTKVGLILGWCRVKGWLVSDSNLRVAKWRKYNKTRESDESLSPPTPSPTPIPSEHPNLKNQEPATPEPSAEPAKAGKKELDPRIRVWADKVYLTDKKKFAKLIVWIKECEKYNYEPVVIAAALERFLPYAASPEVQNWYVYLDKILLKTDKDINRDRHEAEHNRKKEETREASKITNLRNWVKDA